MAKGPQLVTGAAGFSGAWVVRELLAAGTPVIATDRADAIGTPKHRALLSATRVSLDDPGVTWIAADLLDPASLIPLVAKPLSHVFHTASLYDYSAPLDRLRRINVEGTRHLLDALRDQELSRFVHWSTCGVFGKPVTAADGEHANVPFTETSSSPRTAPSGAIGPEGTSLVNAYSVSKWEQEQMIWAASAAGLPVTVVRPAPIYGPGSAYGHSGVILAIAQGLVPAIPADSRNHITASVHVLDIASFAIFAANRPESEGEDYNVVDNSIVSFHEFLHYVALLSGRRLRDVPLIKMRHLRLIFLAAAHAFQWTERSLGLPRPRMLEVQSSTYMASSYWLSNRKTQEAGYEYRYPDVKEGLKDTLSWMREEGWLSDRSLTIHQA